MSANTETTGAPPKGYVRCLKKCGRWSRNVFAAGEETSCYQCNGDRSGGKGEAYPDWTPPIAAPAAHVERRKGPTHAGWECCGDRGTCSRTFGEGGPGWRDYYDGKEPQLGMGDVFCPDHAPPEPAKHGAQSKCGKWLHGDSVAFTQTARAGHEANCIGCNPMLQPTQYREPHAPAQAAPLPFSFTDDENRVHRFATGIERDTASRAYGAWMKAQTGKPYAGPERLPKPQLAADWVEDCLPEGGR